MRDLSADDFWLRERARDLLARDARWRRRLQLWFGIGGVTLAGGSEAFSNVIPDTYKPYAYAAWFIGLGAALISGIIFVWIDEGAPETIVRAQAAIEEANVRGSLIEGLQTEFEWITRLYTVAGALREYAEAVLVTGPGDAQARQQRLGAMLDTLLAEKDTLLLVNDEAWNFAIYLHDLTSDELRCVVCRRPSRNDELALHRSWKPGEGHVGKAFWLAQELVAPDTSEPNVAAFFDAPDAQRKDDDRTRYCSIVSLPIRIQGERPYGVLVATSDKIGRYQPPGLAVSVDNVEPLRVLSASLAMVLRAEQLQVQGGN